MRNRQIAFLLSAVLLLVIAARHSSADFRILIPKVEISDSVGIPKKLFF